MKQSFYLGKLEGEHIYLEGFEWACEWYWSGGYIEGYAKKSPTERNWQSHQHFDGLFLKGQGGIDRLLQLEDCPYDQKTLWLLLDLMKQFYALRDAAEVYQYGGHMCSEAVGVPHVFKPNAMSRALNNDIEVHIIPQVVELLGGAQ